MEQRNDATIGEARTVNTIMCFGWDEGLGCKGFAPNDTSVTQLKHNECPSTRYLLTKFLFISFIPFSKEKKKIFNFCFVITVSVLEPAESISLCLRNGVKFLHQF